MENQETRARRQNKDRSSHKYSERGFMLMTADEKEKKAKEFLLLTSDQFDETKEFQFSYQHFEKLCKQIGFEKKTECSVVDLRESSDDTKKVLFIERGIREDTVLKKVSVSKNLADRMEELFKKEDGCLLQKGVQSRIIELLLAESVDELLKYKRDGKLEIYFSATPDQIL